MWGESACVVSAEVNYTTRINDTVRRSWCGMCLSIMGEPNTVCCGPALDS